MGIRERRGLRPVLPPLAALMVVLTPIPALAAAPAADAEIFPTWLAFEARVEFWIDIYTRYTTRQGVIHDSEQPQVVYGVVDLGGVPEGGTTPFPPTDQEIMRLARERVQEIIRSLENQAPLPALPDLSRQVQAALQRLDGDAARASAADRVRVQRGQADRFRLGLIRSGRYLPALRDIAREEAVPEVLVYLPHVESAFDPLARSHLGAAGLWQFMPATGRRFLHIGGERDERLDPWQSTTAAFRYLKENLEILGSWPLAITAYNHGPYGMLRARRAYGDDLLQIIGEYRSPSFGFASKNFYAEFLAAVRIARSPERWFGPLTPDPPLMFEVFTVPEYVRTEAVAAQMDVALADLRDLNPALHPRAWGSDGMIPRGFELRVPPGQAARLEASWWTVPATARFDRRLDVLWHRVQKGETLTGIAARYGTTVTRLRSVNNLWRQRFIHPGQLLKVRQQEEWVSIAERDARTEGTRHVVQRGETLSDIGRLYGIALRELIDHNNIGDASRIVAGQILLIPGRD